MKIQTYKIIKGWNIHGEAETIPNSKRKICHVVIGETENDYIIEDMFEDIVQAISSSPNTYNITVKIGRDPQIIVLRDGKIVLHNPSTRNHMAYVKEKIKDIPLKTLINAYGEMRINNECLKKLSSSTMAVVAMINEDKGTFYTAEFIYSVLKDYIQEEFYAVSDKAFAENLHSLEYRDLLELSIDVMKYKATNNTENPFFLEILQEEKNIEDIERIIHTEIASRFVTGTITENKRL